VVSGGVRITWEPPDDDGGGTVTGYRVLRSGIEGASGPALLAEVGDVTSYTDRTVEGNTTYHYFIEAVNEAGPGNSYGPIEVHVPEGSGGGGGGDGDDDGDGGDGFPAYDLGLGSVLVAAAAGAGLLLGRRFGRRGV
jgi:hypothetical protein